MLKVREIVLVSVASVCVFFAVWYGFSVLVPVQSQSYYVQSDEDRDTTISDEVVETMLLANPANLEFYETAYQFVDLEESKENGLSDEAVVGGILPHHLLAADLSAKLFSGLEGNDYDTVILIGPNHFSAGQSDIIISGKDWQTPYGRLKNDHLMGQALLDETGLEVGLDDEVFPGEHSISGLVAFVKKTFPKASFLPIIMKSDVDDDAANDLAEALFEISGNRKVLVLASVDFSHGKTGPEAERDDRNSIDAISYFDYQAVYRSEIDSPPSIHTLLRFCELNEAGFVLSGNSNSAVLSGHPDLSGVTSYVTGLFIRGQNYPPKERRIRMLFFGDLMLDRHVRELISENGLDYVLGGLFSDGWSKDDFDLIGANLEGTVTDGGQHYEPSKKYDFAFEPETVAKLADYGFGYFSLANNHFADQGERGMVETRKNLERIGFAFSGDRDGLISDYSSTTVTILGKRIALIGLSGVGIRLDAEKAAEIVMTGRDKADFVIVNIHWGEEYDSESNSGQRALAHRMIDAGADAIIGHHPHVVQESETYDCKPIFYSLGNFVFDQYFSAETQLGLAVSLELSAEGISFESHPIQSTKGRVLFIGTPYQFKD